jgi:hypothetical protein
MPTSHLANAVEIRLIPISIALDRKIAEKISLPFSTNAKSKKV